METINDVFEHFLPYPYRKDDDGLYRFYYNELVNEDLETKFYEGKGNENKYIRGEGGGLFIKGVLPSILVDKNPNTRICGIVRRFPLRTIEVMEMELGFQCLHQILISLVVYNVKMVTPIYIQIDKYEDCILVRGALLITD